MYKSKKSPAEIVMVAVIGGPEEMEERCLGCDGD
jgi:hypothetical protein